MFVLQENMAAVSGAVASTAKDCNAATESLRLGNGEAAERVASLASSVDREAAALAQEGGEQVTLRRLCSIPPSPLGRNFGVSKLVFLHNVQD